MSPLKFGEEGFSPLIYVSSIDTCLALLIDTVFYFYKKYSHDPKDKKEVKSVKHFIWNVFIRIIIVQYFQLAIGCFLQLRLITTAESALEITC